jgi:branched-chain amino acid aminotransferase
MQSDFVWMNGALVKTADAKVPFLNTGLHYGIAIFEGIRAYATDRGPAVFRLRDHLRRFEDSARILGFQDVPYSVDQLMKATAETIRANRFDECYIRPLLYLGEGGWNLTLDSGTPHVGIAVWRQAVYTGSDTRGGGIRAKVSSFTRHHPGANMTKAKISGNYVNSFLAKTEAQRMGFEEAIQLDPEGYVAECTGANIFLVRGGRLVTPPTESILEGITRSTVAALAEDLGIAVTETRLSRDHLYIADEVFVCGTAAEVIGVVDVDTRRIGDGRTGPITRKIQAAYADAVRGKHARSAGWLEYVNAVPATR